MSISIDLTMLVQILLQLRWLLCFEDVGDHFTHPRGRWTWSQSKKGATFAARLIILWLKKFLDLRRWAIKIPRFNTDHRAIIAEITLGKMYIHRTMSLVDDPFLIPFSETFYENDVRFQQLKQYK